MEPEDIKPLLSLSVRSNRNSTNCSSGPSQSDTIYLSSDDEIESDEPPQQSLTGERRESSLVQSRIEKVIGKEIKER